MTHTEALEAALAAVHGMNADRYSLAAAIAAYHAAYGVRDLGALVEAAQGAVAACDQGRMVPRGGACGQTIEASIRASVYNGVPAWPLEELRAALTAPAQTGER